MPLAFNEPERNYQPIFVARQPIFLLDNTIWGYELLFRHSDMVTSAHIKDEVVATAKVIADGFTIATTGISRGKKFLINFPPQLLIQETALSLPKNICIIEILETVKPEPTIIKACLQMKKDGYILAIDDFVGDPGFEPFLEIADIIKVDVFDRKPEEIIKITQQLNRYQCKLLAEKIENRETYQLTKSLGYYLFQGFFFSRPETVTGRKISTEKITKMRLLQELADEDFEFKKLARIISNDISLSYRLLKHINSSYYALPKKIQSIPQAITLLGSKPLLQWLTVILISDIDSRQRAIDLVFTSVSRGRFLELTTRSLVSPTFKKETMFLLGLFSNLDSLLGLNMEEIMAEMPINSTIKDALCGKENEAHKWLALAVSIDNGQWKEAEQLLAAHKLNPKKISVFHIRAKVWASRILEFQNQS